MAKIEQAAKVSWRVLVKLTEAERGRLCDAAFTPIEQRSSDQIDEIERARELDDKLRRRANGVNALHCGRVNGQVVIKGQPRGQKRG